LKEKKKAQSAGHSWAEQRKRIGTLTRTGGADNKKGDESGNERIKIRTAMKQRRIAFPTKRKRSWTHFLKREREKDPDGGKVEKKVKKRRFDVLTRFRCKDAHRGHPE